MGWEAPHGQIQEPAPPTDEQLVDAARAGNETAFAELFTRHRARLLSLALQRRLPTQDAEDVVQQTMLKAWQALHRFRGDSSFVTWITRVLMNEIFQLQRKRKRMRLEEMEDASILTAILEAGSPITPRLSLHQLNQEQRLLVLERNRLLHTALRSLPESLRTVLRMQFFDERPLEEIAAQLQRPVATVKSRRHRARLELRKRFARRLRGADLTMAFQ